MANMNGGISGGQLYTPFIMPPAYVQAVPPMAAPPAYVQVAPPMAMPPAYTQVAAPTNSTTPYGIKQVGTQQYMPINQKRQLTPQEQKEIEKRKKSWPSWYTSYATPATGLIASPFKSGIVSTIGTALLGGLTGLIFTLESRSRLTYALIGAGIGAVLGFFIGPLNRKKKNEDIIDLMQRLPEGASKRDILSDPVYQADLTRKANSDNTSGTFFDAALLGGVLGSSYSSSSGKSRSTKSSSSKSK
jgi:hypothetical protein